MNPKWALQLRTRRGEPDGAKAAAERILDWIESRYLAEWEQLVPVARAGAAQFPAPGHELRIDRQEAPCRVHVHWSFPAGARTAWWRHDLSARDQDGAVVVGLELAPDGFDPHWPKSLPNCRTAGNVEIQALGVGPSVQERLAGPGQGFDAVLAAALEELAAMTAGAATAPLAKPVAEAAATRDFDSVLAAVLQAREDFPEQLRFLKSALVAAEDSPYDTPERVYDLLEALALVADEWRAGAGAMGKTWKQALAEFGFDMAPGISMTTAGKYGHFYDFVYKGQSQRFDKHVTLGACQPNTCLSLHWRLDDEDRVVVVGHCGRHLPNTLT